MSKYHLKCSTHGCKETVLFTGTGKAGAQRAEWLDGKNPCEACKKAERDAENAKAALANQSAGLPALQGSEKQIAWAETIRIKRIEKMERYVEISETKDRDALPQVMTFHSAIVSTLQKSDVDKKALQVAIEGTLLRDAMESVKTQCKASWWIDNQNDIDAGREFAAALIFKLKQNALPEDAETEDDRIKRIEALAELTVMPAEPISNNPVLISIDHKTNKVTVLIDANCEASKKIMINSPFVTKKIEGFYGTRSDYSTWSLICTNEQYVSPQDRAAEICAKMIEAGVPVRVPDLDIRDMALNQNYSPYSKRWISVIDGSFVQIPHFKDDVLYTAIRKIKGSKWTSKGCVVPLSKYDDIYGFAQIYGYKITKAVRRNMDDLKAASEQAILAPKSFKAAKPAATLINAPLSVSDAPTQIADELRDE